MVGYSTPGTIESYVYDDAFGNPVKRMNGKPRPMVADTPPLCFGGAYDPALAPFYPPVQPHGHPVGLFTSLENHEGQIHDPAGLMKFLYAGQTPVFSPVI